MQSRTRSSLFRSLCEKRRNANLLALLLCTSLVDLYGMARNVTVGLQSTGTLFFFFCQLPFFFFSLSAPLFTLHSLLIFSLTVFFFFDSVCFSLPRIFFIESQISVFCSFFSFCFFLFPFLMYWEMANKLSDFASSFFFVSVHHKTQLLFFFSSLFVSYFLSCFSVSRLYSNSLRASIGLVAGFYVCSF